MSEERRHLHPLSSIFLLGGALKEIALPLGALLFFGRHSGNWEAWAALPVLGFGLWAVLRARYFHYEIGESELLVREGVLDRAQRHIPFARIQGVSQRRKLLHRLLGVTEVHIESAAGGKPEAVLKVLSLAAAAELETLLRGKSVAGSAPATAPGPGAAPVSPASPILHALPASEILRLGLVSNRGMVMLGVALGLVMQNDTLRTHLGQSLLPAARWAGALMATEVESGHGALLALGAVLGLLGMFLLLRLLSVLLAFFRYHGFTLARDGERLLVQHGLLTVVRNGARLPRLQRWELEETWLHRRFGRCRLAVSVAGSRHGHEHGASPETGFTELAPIATPAQAQALLRVCLPALDWDRLNWQALHPATAKRRLFGQARWVLPALLACAWADAFYAWPLPLPALVAIAAVLALAMLWHARAWARFGAIAESGDVLLYRSGVWSRRWIVVVGARLQNLRLYSSPLDRSLGIAHLQADTQGGSRRHRALDIPCLGRGAAETLRASLWRRIQDPVTR